MYRQQEVAIQLDVRHTGTNTKERGMDNIDSYIEEWVKDIDIQGILKNWKINTPEGDESVYSFFRKGQKQALEKSLACDEYKRLNLYSDLAEKFPLAEIKARIASGEPTTFLEWVVVYYHYSKAFDAISVIACEREGLTTLALEFKTIADNAKSNAMAIPLEKINEQLDKVVPYMNKKKHN